MTTTDEDGSMTSLTELPDRTLMGPGPSDVDPRVLEALARPTIGHLDPAFLELMDDVQRMLREVLETRNPFTIAVSGTGSAAMEAAVDNLVEPGDRVVIGVNGVFGTRLVDMAGRAGARVVALESPWGEPIPREAVEEALQAEPAKLVMLVHGETSTGVMQPLEGIGDLCREQGALLLIDCVTSLGGAPVHLDDWGVDVCYSGTQKCLSVPPGLSPLSFSPRAIEALEARRSKVASWYLDMTLIRDYWGSNRRYHHTAPINMVYALHEGLRLVLEEGLEARWRRHRTHAEALWAGLEALDWSLFVDEPYRLPPLTTARPPDGVDEADLRRRLLTEHGIEIGGGLGPLAGKVVRIGLMGASSTPEHLLGFLGAVEGIMGVRPGTGIDAAQGILEAAEDSPA
jgi:alanine-glyoxylate transaminase/serine-glyoxylate transaminase/serine-pyruvate transaminase